MALRKSKTDEKGYSADYHRIIGYSYNPDHITTIKNPDDEEGNPVPDTVLNGRTIAIVALYKDQVARQAGKTACEMKSYKFDGGDEPSGRAACYELLKDHEDFEGSEDC